MYIYIYIYIMLLYHLVRPVVGGDPVLTNEIGAPNPN